MPPLRLACLFFVSLFWNSADFAFYKPLEVIVRRKAIWFRTIPTGDCPCPSLDTVPSKTWPCSSRLIKRISTSTWKLILTFQPQYLFAAATSSRCLLSWRPRRSVLLQWYRSRTAATAPSQGVWGRFGVKSLYLQRFDEGLTLETLRFPPAVSQRPQGVSSSGLLLCYLDNRFYNLLEQEFLSTP